MSADWANIPSVILLEIFQYLNRRDIIVCAETCTSWNHATTNPLLWKDLKLYLDKDLTDPITNSTIKNHASHIRTLNMSYSLPYLTARWVRNRMGNIAQDTSHLLTILRDYNVSIIYINITDWYFAWKYKKVIYHLTCFLKQQSHLKYINLSNCALNKIEILKILKSCQLSAQNITHLNLHGAFQDCHYIFSNNGFVMAMQQFTNLGTLKIDYSCLSERLLSLYTRYQYKFLKFMEIVIQDTDSRSHIISSVVWRNVSKNCTDLKVALYFNNICHHDELSHYLVDTIPLKIFSLCCGQIWDQKRSRNYCATLKLIMKNYGHIIEQISLQLRYNAEMIELVLYDIITNCKQLKMIEFDGILRNFDFIQDICNLQSSSNYLGDYNYKYFQVISKNPTVHNNIILSEIWKEYAKQMEKNNVCFHVENHINPAVKIFC